MAMATACIVLRLSGVFHDQQPPLRGGLNFSYVAPPTLTLVSVHTKLSCIPSLSVCLSAYRPIDLSV